MTQQAGERVALERTIADAWSSWTHKNVSPGDYVEPFDAFDAGYRAALRTPGPADEGRLREIAERYARGHSSPNDVLTLITMTSALTVRLATAERAATERADPLIAFHDAWVNAEVSHATGNPDLVKKLRAELIQAHKAAHDTIAAIRATPSAPASRLMELAEAYVSAANAENTMIVLNMDCPDQTAACIAAKSALMAEVARVEAEVAKCHDAFMKQFAELGDKEAQIATLMAERDVLMEHNAGYIYMLEVDQRVVKEIEAERDAARAEGYGSAMGRSDAGNMPTLQETLGMAPPAPAGRLLELANQMANARVMSQYLEEGTSGQVYWEGEHQKYQSAFTAEVARVCEELDRLTERCAIYKDQVETGARRIAAAEAERDAALAALEPFARAAADFAGMPDKRCVLKHKSSQTAPAHIMVGDLRRAATATRKTDDDR